MRGLPFIILLASWLTLGSGCGRKGDLYLPPADEPTTAETAAS